MLKIGENNLILILLCYITHTSSKIVCDYTAMDSSWFCNNQQLSEIPISKIQNKSAKILNFANNDIKLSWKDMNDLMNLEYRKIVTDIILDKNNISELPENLSWVFPNLEIMQLSNNKIKNIKHQFNKLDKLKLLNLDNNPIANISHEAFSKLKHMEKLSLINTNITNTTYLSIGSSKLQIFVNSTAATTTTTLSMNSTEIGNNLFYNKIRLANLFNELGKSIQLHRDNKPINVTNDSSESACVYRIHDSAWFCCNQQLRRIPISEIKDQPANILNFAYNDIKLSSNDMNDCMSLEYRNIVTYIIFDYNNIEELPQNLAEVFPNLEIIYLRNNKIKNVKYQFNQLDKLKQLNLDNNPITTISHEAFTRLKNLEKLSLININVTDDIKQLSIRNSNLVIDSK